MKKQIVSLILLSLIIGSLTLAKAQIGNAQSGTQVSGVITTNTTWTQANSPYTLTGNLLVNQNVTLTIQPGVVVDLNSFYIMVNGTLNAVGNSTNLIAFNEGQIIIAQPNKVWNEINSAASIIENAFIGSTLTLSNSAKIANDTIYGLITIQETVGTLISNNIIKGGIFCFYNASANISNNIILNNGILMGTAVNQNMTVRGNTISGADSGIVCTTGGPSFDSIFGLIENNLIVNNTNGIYIRNYGGPIHITIRNNTITNNYIGILSQLNTTVIHNNIYDNPNYNIYNYDTHTLNSSYNWWGTTNLTTISRSIYDFKNESQLGTVTYTPCLTTPNTQAPTYINATTGSGGSISPNGIIRLNYGDNQTFTITPNRDYLVSDVLVNGTSVSAVNSYSIQNITGATTVSVNFAPDPTSTPSPSPNPTSSSTATPTPSPTTNPTQAPTSNPTSSPTSQPTNPTPISAEPTPTYTPTSTAQPTQNPTSAPTPTPTAPEFPALILLPLFAAILFSIVAVKIKKQANKN